VSPYTKILNFTSCLAGCSSAGNSFPFCWLLPVAMKLNEPHYLCKNATSHTKYYIETVSKDLWVGPTMPRHYLLYLSFLIRETNLVVSKCDSIAIVVLVGLRSNVVYLVLFLRTRSVDVTVSLPSPFHRNSSHRRAHSVLSLSLPISPRCTRSM
jgi:hypothetical protein